MKNSSKEPLEFSIKVANIIFALGRVISALVMIIAVYKIYYPLLPTTLNFYYISIIFGGVSIVLFTLALKLNNELKVNLSLLLVTSVISIYFFETYLSIKNNYDSRTKIEVIKDLRKKRIDVFPNVKPTSFINSNGLMTNNGPIWPLGSISNITTILGNELGYYPIIDLDEHGFNNPKGLYNNNIDIMLTGDSFTEGYSVNADKNIRAVLTQLGNNVISLGKGGNGPLVELAVLKEYAEPLKPKIVLWLFYTNDLDDLKKFNGKPSLLRKYLNDDNFSQNLISRQSEIDSVLKSYVEMKWVEWNKVKTSVSDYRLIRILKLYNFRLLINQKPDYLHPREAVAEEELFVFKKIIKKSKEMVLGWGGELYLVYLPDFARYKFNTEHPIRKDIFTITSELDIPVIDIHNEVFVSHPDPLSLFSFSKFGHYNIEGYDLVAKAIDNKIKINRSINKKN